jgi:hypothetical protein
MKLIIGAITALLFSGIFIFSIENDCSFIQIAFGFVVFLIPIIFVSEIKNNSRVFAAVVFSILFAYLTIKWGYYSTFIGVLQAIIVGFPIHYFVVRNTKIN